MVFENITKIIVQCNVHLGKIILLRIYFLNYFFFIGKNYIQNDFS
jgi:hypothetical protein